MSISMTVCGISTTGKNGVFKKPIIGRLVEHSHPPKAVDTVQRIVEAYKSGEKDTADFWIEFKGSFLYIRYFAVRDEQGQYEGVLEVSQDVRIRKLKGQKRFLDGE